METKHTTGPWFYVDYAGTFNIQDSPDYTGDDLLDYSDVARSLMGRKKVNPITKEIAIANAKLIAVAPKLLEFAIEMVKRYPNSPWIYEQANDIIKQATE